MSSGLSTSGKAAIHVQQYLLYVLFEVIIKDALHFGLSGLRKILAVALRHSPCSQAIALDPTLPEPPLGGNRPRQPPESSWKAYPESYGT